MKQLIKKIFDIVTFIKVASICLAAIYFSFWFYRFFNLWNVDYIYPIFDILILPIKSVIETIQFDGTRVNEMGYIFFGIIMLVVSYICSRLEFLTVEWDRKYDLKVLADTQKKQKAANEILKKEYDERIEKFDCVNVLLSFVPEFLNELVAQNNSITLEKGLLKAYSELASYLKEGLKNSSIIMTKKGVFISFNGFEQFDKMIDVVLGGIKFTKSVLESDYIHLKFLLTLDVQRPEFDSSKSFANLVKIAEIGYYGKAVATAIFNMRFELYKEKSKYITEILGFSVKDRTYSENTDLYLVKTKPTFI